MAASSTVSVLPSSTSFAPSSTPSIIPDGIVCSLQELQVPAKYLHCLTRSETIGLTLISTAGFVSLSAVLYFFTRVLINVIHERRKLSQRTLVSRPLDIYMLSLFSANLLHGIGSVLDVKWLNEGKVYVGSACWTQGVLQGASSAVIALTTLAIALHTFCTIYWSIGHSLLVPRLVVIGLWSFVILVTTVMYASHRNPEDPFVGPATQWCYITSSFLVFGIAEEWLWMWLAVVVSTCTYIPLFIWCLRYLRTKHRKRIALTMLIYPLIYSIMVIPKSVTRLLDLASTAHTTPAETMGFQVFYTLIGFVDVVVFFATRRGLLLFGPYEPMTELYED